MTYEDLFRALYLAEYDRVERDDRLLDIFPTQTREKGVELWERWLEHDVRILRVRQPFDPATVELFGIARGQLASLLLHNRPATLDDFELIAQGEAAADCL